MPLDTSRKVTLAIGVAAATVIAVALIGAVDVKRLENDARWVAHTHEVRSQIRTMSRDINEAKADARGFLLTGDSSFVARSRANVDNADAALRQLQALTIDDADQQRRLALLRSLLDVDEQLSAHFDSLATAADAAEAALLQVRLERQTVSSRVADATSMFLVFGAGILSLLLWRSIARDLTGRAHAEAELRASEAKFSGILDVADEAIVTVDQSQTIVNFNRGAETIFGYERAEVLGRRLDVLLPERHSQGHGANINHFASAGDIARRMGDRRQIRGRRKDGSEFSAEASISKLMTAHGWLFTAVMRDVTERQRQEHAERALSVTGLALADTLDYDATLQAAATIPVPWVGAWSVLVVAEENEAGSPHLRRVVGDHADPALNHALHEWEREPIDWDSPEALIDVMRSGQHQRIDVASDEWIDAHLPGPGHIEIARRMQACSLLVVPLPGRQHTLAAWMIGSSSDRRFDDADTALAKALAERTALAIENARNYRQSQRATAARDQVLSVVSHDLRNPLSAVSMLARRLVEDPLTDDARHSIGENILSSADWMHRLLQDLLDVTSIETGRLSLEIEPQTVEGIIEAATDMFHPQAAHRGIALRTELPARLPWVSADGSRITQVLANLIGNALKFTGQGGTVTVGATAVGDEVVTAVSDTGPGIPELELPHIFDRFWHARRGSGARGHGLGLAIAQGIVRAHGGRLWVKSVAGRGSTFFFALPCSRPDADAGLHLIGREENDLIAVLES